MDIGCVLDSPLNSPSGKRKSVRVSRYFEDGPIQDSLYSKEPTVSRMPVQTNGAAYTTHIPGKHLFKRRQFLITT